MVCIFPDYHHNRCIDYDNCIEDICNKGQLRRKKQCACENCVIPTVDAAVFATVVFVVKKPYAEQADFSCENRVEQEYERRAGEKKLPVQYAEMLQPGYKKKIGNP